MRKSNTPRNNTVLILEDSDELIASLFEELEGEDFSEFDVLKDEKKPSAPRRRLHTRRHTHPGEFERIFESMIHHGTHFPVLINDLTMPGDNGELDPDRGLRTARHVRSLDPRINIVLVTARIDMEGPEVCSMIGGNTHFVRRPYDATKFVELVVRLVDEWNLES